ncbi:MAG: DUF1826 domain-containing protein [Myxococcota bacterium]
MLRESTYCGPGTQWVAEGDFDRPPRDPNAQPRFQAGGSRVRQTATGDPTLLKGHYFEGHGFGALGQSLPVASTRVLDADVFKLMGPEMRTWK